MSISPADEYDGNPIIAIAEQALRAFGALTREQADLLLPMWRWTPQLSRREIAAVLNRFPDTESDDERDTPDFPPEDMPPRGADPRHGLHDPK